MYNFTADEIFFLNVGIFFLKMHQLLNYSKFDNILLSPLDWGMGHTTRCFPIIEALIKEKKNIYIACEPHSTSENILKSVFPKLTYLPLQGYNVHYGKSKNSFILNIIAQLPKIFCIIQYENKKVQEWVKKYNIDLVISDNRFGFYSKSVHSVFITHQLHVLASNSFLEKIIQKINYIFIQKYDECWVPDMEDKIHNLAGKLSHPDKLPNVPVKYIGLLSRLKNVAAREQQYDILVLLSGPEPQRTILEHKLYHTLIKRKEKILFVRGLANAKTNLAKTSQIEVVNYLHADALSEKLAESEYVIARSGYTTVMEMMKLQKKCIFIPTPGQTEQEYLAEKLMLQKCAFGFQQNENNYNEKIDKALKFNYSSIS